MKIKVFLIPGVILFGAGIAIAGVAASKIDFNSTKDVTFYDVKYSSSEVKTIVVESAADKVKLVSAERDDIYIKAKEQNNRKYNITLDGGRLDIKEEYNWWENLLFLPWDNSFYTEPLIVEVPNNMLYDYVLHANAGSFEVSDIKANSLEVELSAGSFKLNNVEAINIVEVVNAGSVIFDNTTTTKLNVTVNAGSARFIDTASGEFAGEVNAGEIVYNGVVSIKGDLEVNAGSIVMNFKDGMENYCVDGRGNGNVKINTDKNAGSIDINYNK